MYIRNFQMCDWSIKENIRVNEPSYQNEKFLLFDNGIIKVRRIFYIYVCFSEYIHINFTVHHNQFT